MKTYEYICAKEETENHRQPSRDIYVNARRRGCTMFAARAFANREMPGWDEIAVCGEDGETLWAFKRSDIGGQVLPDRIMDKPEPRAARMEEVPADFHKEARQAIRQEGMTAEQRDREDEERIYEYARQMRPIDPVPRGSLADKRKAI